MTHARRALSNPVGIVLVAASVTLAALTAWHPQLAAWADRAGAILLIGLAAYLGAALVAAAPAPPPRSPALDQVRRVRRGLSDRLTEREVLERGGRSPLTGVLRDTVRRLDHELIPALEQAVVRHAAVRDQLRRYESGELPPPAPDVLGRLREMHRRQRAAIAACVQEAANADAALVALFQEADDASAVDEARRWTDRLLAAHDGLARELHGA